MFPKENLMILGSLSPTALAHDYGYPVDQKGNDLRPQIEDFEFEIEQLKDKIAETVGTESKIVKRDLEKKERELFKLRKNSNRLIDLENKIIVFLEDPPLATWARLRPIMSHDEWETTYKFTDRHNKTGPMTQVTAIIRGWPVFIAFKAEESPKEGYRKDVWEQILSRGVTVPVEQSSEKYFDANKITGIKHGLPQPAIDKILHKKEFRECKEIIIAIRDKMLLLKSQAREATDNKALPHIFFNPFYDVITKHFPHKKAPNMRECERFMGIVKCHAVANIFNRPTLNIGGVSYIICTIHDLSKAVELYFSEESRKTIFGKIPTNQVKFFEKVIIPLSEKFTEGISSTQMQDKFKEVFGDAVSTNTINYHYLQPLENLDLITRDDDPLDKRKKLTKPLRTDILVQDVQLNTLLKNGDIFSLETLKEQLEQLRKLIVLQPENNNTEINRKGYSVTDFDNNNISIEDLYAKYFSKKCISISRFSNNYLSKDKNSFFLPKEQEDSTEKEKVAIPKELGEKGKEKPNKENSLRNSTEIQTGLYFTELEKKIRKLWNKGTEQELFEIILKNSDLSKKEVEDLVNGWIKFGVIAKNPEGKLQWLFGGLFFE